MNTYTDMERLLQAKPEARERKNKARAVRYFLIRKYPALKDIDANTLHGAIIDAGTYDRAWRKVTEEHPNLRGKDYNLKATLVKAKQHELGYY